MKIAENLHVIEFTSETGKYKNSRVPRPGHLRNTFLSTLSQPPGTPKTSTRPRPTCPAAAIDWPNCSPTRGCRGVGLPVGTRRLPRLGGGDFLPGGPRSDGWHGHIIQVSRPATDLRQEGKGAHCPPQFLDLKGACQAHPVFIAACRLTYQYESIA